MTDTSNAKSSHKFGCVPIVGIFLGVTALLGTFVGVLPFKHKPVQAAPELPVFGWPTITLYAADGKVLGQWHSEDSPVAGLTSGTISFIDNNSGDKLLISGTYIVTYDRATIIHIN